MNLYEYESKKLLKKFNFLILNSYLTKKFFFLKNKIYKIQVHSGYRKKNNGIILMNNINQCIDFFKKWENSFLFKKKINSFLIEDFLFFEKELYITFYINQNLINFVISVNGGIDIENELNLNFLKIKFNYLIINYSIFDYLSNFFLKNSIIKKIINFIYKLYNFFCLKNLLLIEINPLVIKNNFIYILDTKIILNKKTIENFSNKISNLLNINYIQLKGKICCIVNGAGLALNTLDLFNFYNENCYNFLDLSGKINDKKLIILFNFLITKKILVLFINIFGGIVSCKKILFSVLNLMYFNFNFKLIIKLDGIFSNYSKKILINYNNLIIIEEFLKCIKNSIILLNVK
ncbi:succinyl-CoA synthetase beta subunit [Candidatus Carsonella ruddii HT isolate Thao2000]|uniref:Succinyl-CoA synthetase beta subunit n=1 Tax=Candidatus Carsonella ruddii HT isolate Thao2000 TaxID=1202539 RepID=J3YQD2_CARRU|nr:ATP-grasp domain-containing protein [Candidatus Carsonella ruddii]AFP84148.1 succinyl-CoA synthetase beta subunit [Candidatus Carsonella ruddii HT isolate Thao2000]